MYQSSNIVVNQTLYIKIEKEVSSMPDIKKDDIYLKEYEYNEDILQENTAGEEPTEEDLKHIEEDFAFDEFEEEKDEENKDDYDFSETDNNETSKDTFKIYLNQLGEIPICTPEEEIYYCNRIRNGDEKAKQEFAVKNLRLVVSIAKRYVNRGMQIQDIVQEGNIGLMKAIEKFDITKGYKFSTYATWWIRQAITRGIADQSRTIRIPVHMSENINRYKRICKMFFQENGRNPNNEEVALLMNITVEKAKEIEIASIEPVSFETPIGEEEDSTLGDFIAAETESTEEISEKWELKDAINKALGTLSIREAKVLKLRFGLEDGIPRTLEEVGNQFNVTRERIRQIEAKALRKLRSPSKHLRNFINNK